MSLINKMLRDLDARHVGDGDRPHGRDQPVVGLDRFALVRLVGAASGFLYFWARHHGKHRATRAARQALSAVKEAGAVRADEALEKRNRALFPEVESLRAAKLAAASPGAVPDAAAIAVETRLKGLVVPGVNVCKPVDFKGDQDLVCLRCEGFAECSLRYAAGAPREISVRPVK